MWVEELTNIADICLAKKRPVNSSLAIGVWIRTTVIISEKELVGQPVFFLSEAAANFA